MFNWIKRKKWLVVNAILIGVLVSMLGVQVINRSDAVDHSVKIGVGNEKVITLGSIAYAAGSVDYTYDGADDNVQFQAALNALPATGGRLVDVSAVQKNFSATVTRAIPNVIIEGSGFGSYFTNNGVTAIFTAGGNGWSFNALRTDAGGIAMGATTGWQWINVNDGGGTVYDLRTPAGSIVNGAFTASSVTDSGLTSGRVPIAGVGGLLGDNANLTFDGTSLQVSGANVTRTATYIVAASDAPAHVKAQADYVSDGTADEFEINAALAALPANGGRVQLSAGTFTLTSPILVNTGNVTLWGESRYATTITPANNANSNSITVATDISHVELSHFNIAGNKANEASGHGIQFGAADGRITDVHVQNAHDEGIYILGSGTQSAYVYMDDVRVEGSGLNNIRLSAFTNDSKLHKVIAGNSGQSNFYIETANNEFIGCEAFSPAGGWPNFYLVGNPWGTRIIGSFINDSPFHSVVIAPFGGSSGSDIIISGNHFWRTSLGNNNLFDDIFVDTTNVVVARIVIVGNDFFGTTHRYVLSQTGGNNLSSTILNSNVVQTVGTALYSIANNGGSNSIGRNGGYVTESSGSATLLNGTAAIVVAHGLAATPTAISITFSENSTNSMVNWWVDTVGAANFTFNGVDPGASNLDFYWEAKVR